MINYFHWSSAILQPLELLLGLVRIPDTAAVFLLSTTTPTIMMVCGGMRRCLAHTMVLVFFEARRTPAVIEEPESRLDPAKTGPDLGSGQPPEPTTDRLQHDQIAPVQPPEDQHLFVVFACYTFLGRWCLFSEGPRTSRAAIDWEGGINDKSK
jgi:hypothetical protein